MSRKGRMWCRCACGALARKKHQWPDSTGRPGEVHEVSKLQAPAATQAKPSTLLLAKGSSLLQGHRRGNGTYVTPTWCLAAQEIMKSIYFLLFFFFLATQIGWQSSVDSPNRNLETNLNSRLYLPQLVYARGGESNKAEDSSDQE